MREITKERVKKLLNDWKKAGWMELISRYNKVFDILPTEDFFWEMGDRYPHEIFKAEVQRRGERYARVNRNAIHVVDVISAFSLPVRTSRTASPSKIRPPGFGS